MPVGFITAIAYLWLARPVKFSILVGSVVAIAGLLIRALASGHVRKNEVLTVTGLYAHTRNPLYFGSLVLATGFVLASRNWWVGLLVVVIFAIIYMPVIKAEEELLRDRFPEFVEYERNVPRLFPRLRPYQSSSESFSWHLYWKHREYNAALGAALLIAALVAKAFWFA